MTERSVALFGHSGFGHSLVILVWTLVIPTSPALHLSTSPKSLDSARRTQRLHPYRRRCALEREAGPVSILLAAQRAQAGRFRERNSDQLTDFSDRAVV